MRIVLPGALPDPREARELTTYLASTAPTLLGWLQRGRATATPADPADAGCTPLEQWQLAVCGFQPQTGQNLAAGLGPLLAPDATAPNQTVWLAELLHVSPSRDCAPLLPAPDPAITPHQSIPFLRSDPKQIS